MKKTLDFIIVGSQKAGTTSLASYLDNNPQVYIPPEKEVPFFVHESMKKRGWPWFLDTYFAQADPSALWGTSSPQYMMYPESFKTIKESLPDVKIIVTLRDPIARMLSHFDMASRFGVESRPLNRMVEEQLMNVDVLRRTSYPDKTGKYIVAGEYGRILEELFAHFDRSEVLIVHFDDIRSDAQQVVDRLADFLGLEHFSPDNLQVVRMKGGARKRLPINHDRFISQAGKLIRLLGIGRLIPNRLKFAVGYVSGRLDEWNVDSSSKSRPQDLHQDLLRALKEHYKKDAAHLKKIGVEAPWLEGWTHGRR